jgi:uncharacterized coiled-coil protein SlyX
MNVLSDFEIRLQKLFPDTAEQDQIFKLGNQIIEKDMLIEKHVIEIAKLTRKIAKIGPVVKHAVKKTKKSSAVIPQADDLLVINGAGNKLKATSKTVRKSAPVKSGNKVKTNKK